MTTDQHTPETPAWTPTPTNCDHCGAPTFTAADDSTDTGDGPDTRAFDLQPHDLGIYVLAEPGHVRKLTVRELMDAGRTGTPMHGHHPHPRPCDRPAAPAPSLFTL